MPGRLLTCMSRPASPAARRSVTSTLCAELLHALYVCPAGEPAQSVTCPKQCHPLVTNDSAAGINKHCFQSALPPGCARVPAAHVALSALRHMPAAARWPATPCGAGRDHSRLTGILASITLHSLQARRVWANPRHTPEHCTDFLAGWPLRRRLCPAALNESNVRAQPLELRAPLSRQRLRVGDVQPPTACHKFDQLHRRAEGGRKQHWDAALTMANDSAQPAQQAC